MFLSRAIKDPLGVARLVLKLERALQNQGLKIIVSADMVAFAEAKRKARGFDPAPMHDHSVCDFSGDRGLWMGLEDSEGKIVGIQAYRCDKVDISLAEWCANYMIGVYMRRSEILVPAHAHPPKNSVAQKLNGILVYHGEVWIDKSVKGKEVVADFSIMGHLLALLKWNYDAIWALTSQSIATRGYPGRMGYPVIERGFLRWQWHSDDIEPIEYLTVAERHHIENLVEEPVTNLASPFGSAVMAAGRSDYLKAN